MIRTERLGKVFSRPRGKRNSDSERDPRASGKLFHALRDVNVDVPEGKIIGLLGANGAGKTTLMRILAGSLKPTAGRVFVRGIDVSEDPMRVRQTIGFLSGTVGLYGRLTPRETVTYFGRLYGLSGDTLCRRVSNLFCELEIASFADRRTDHLSSGMKQRVAIARTVVHEPEVIIFDEPTTGLDVPSACGILQYIERCRLAGTSVVFSTHHMHEVEQLCESVIILDKGEVIFQGTVAGMRNASGARTLADAYMALTSTDKRPVLREPLREMDSVSMVSK